MHPQERPTPNLRPTTTFLVIFGPIDPLQRPLIGTIEPTDPHHCLDVFAQGPSVCLDVFKIFMSHCVVHSV